MAERITFPNLIVVDGKQMSLSDMEAIPRHKLFHAEHLKAAMLKRTQNPRDPAPYQAIAMHAGFLEQLYELEIRLEEQTRMDAWEADAAQIDKDLNDLLKKILP